MSDKKEFMKRKREEEEPNKNKKIKLIEKYPYFLPPNQLKEVFDKGECIKGNPEGQIIISDFKCNKYGGRYREMHPKFQSKGTKWEVGTVKNPISFPFGLAPNEKLDENDPTGKTKVPLDKVGELNGVATIRYYPKDNKYYEKEADDFNKALLSIDSVISTNIKNDCKRKINLIETATKDFIENNGTKPDNNDIKTIIGNEFYENSTDIGILKCKVKNLGESFRSMIKVPKKRDNSKPIPYTKLVFSIKKSDPKIPTTDFLMLDSNNGDKDEYIRIRNAEKLFGKPFKCWLQGGIHGIQESKNGWGSTAKPYTCYITEFTKYQEKSSRNGSINVKEKVLFSIDEDEKQENKNYENSGKSADPEDYFK
jgi:hypothetical protein